VLLARRHQPPSRRVQPAQASHRGGAEQLRLAAVHGEAAGACGHPPLPRELRVRLLHLRAFSDEKVGES
jgi:hypothetical protein